MQQPHAAKTPPPHVVTGGGVGTATNVNASSTSTSLTSKRTEGREAGVEARGAATSLRNRNRHNGGASPPIRVGIPHHAPSAQNDVNAHCSSNGVGVISAHYSSAGEGVIGGSSSSNRKDLGTSLTVSTTGFNRNQNDRISLAIKSAGHRYNLGLSGGSGSVLVVNKDMRDSVKFVRAAQFGIPCVTEDWIAVGKVPRNVSDMNNTPHASHTSGGAPGSVTDPKFYPPCSVNLLHNRYDSVAVMVTALTWGTITTTMLQPEEYTLLTEMVKQLQIEVTGSLTQVSKLLVISDALLSTLPKPSTNQTVNSTMPYTGSNMKISFALKKGIPIMTLTEFLQSYLPGRKEMYFREVSRLQQLNSSSCAPPPSAMMMMAKNPSPTIVIISAATTSNSLSPSKTTTTSSGERKIQQACLELGLVRLPVDVLLNSNPSPSSASVAPCTYVLVDTCLSDSNVKNDTSEAPPMVPESVLDALNPSISSKQADSIRRCHFVTLAWLWESHRQKQLLNPCGTRGGCGSGGEDAVDLTTTSSRPSPSSNATSQFQWVPPYITLCRIRSVTEKREIIQAASKLGAVVLEELILSADLLLKGEGGQNVRSHHRPVSTSHIVCGLDTVPSNNNPGTINRKNTAPFSAEDTDGFSLARHYEAHTISSKLRKVWSVKRGGSWCSVVTPGWILQSAALGRWVEERPFVIHPLLPPTIPPPTSPHHNSNHKPPTTTIPITIGEKRQRDDSDGDGPIGNLPNGTGRMNPPHNLTAVTARADHLDESNQRQTIKYQEVAEEKDEIADALALLFGDEDEVPNLPSTTAFPSIANHCQTQYSVGGSENGDASLLSQVNGTTPPKFPPTPKQQQQFPYSLGKYDEAYGNDNNIQKMPSPPPKILDSQHVVYHHDDGDCGPTTSWKNGLTALGELYKKVGGGGGPPAGIFFGDLVSVAAPSSRRSQLAEKPATIDIDDDDGDDGGVQEERVVVPVVNHHQEIESEHLIRAAQPPQQLSASRQTTSTRPPMPQQVVNERDVITTTSTFAAATTTGRASVANNNNHVPTTATTTSAQQLNNSGLTHVLFIAKAARDRLPNNICTLVQDLGGELAMTADACTHYICTKPVKTETLLCCLASGKWILSPKYLDDLLLMHANEVEAGNIPPISNGRASVSSSTTTGGVGGTVSLSVIGSSYYPNRIASLSEELYEWSSALIFSANNSGGSFSGSSASLGTSTSALADACPRQRKSLTRCFSSWKVVLICSVASRTTSFTKVLVAGGCTILASYTKEELHDAAAAAATSDEGGGSRLLAATRGSIKKHRAIEIPPETTHVLCDDDALTATPLIRPLVKTAILQGPLKSAVRHRVPAGSAMTRSSVTGHPITTRLGSGGLSSSNNDATTMVVTAATKYGSTLAPHFHGALRMEFLVHALCVERQDPSIFVEIDFST